MIDFSSSWDGVNVVALCKYPVDGELGRCDASLCGQGIEVFNQLPITRPVLIIKAGMLGTKVSGVQGANILRNAARQCPSRNR